MHRLISFLGVYIFSTAVFGAEVCHYVSVDGKTWTKERVFCFDSSFEDKFSVRLTEKGKVIYSNQYVSEKLSCATGAILCDQFNYRHRPINDVTSPEEWPSVSVLQWIAANYYFETYYRTQGTTVTGILYVPDTDIAQTLLFCSSSPEGLDSKCIKNMP